MKETPRIAEIQKLEHSQMVQTELYLSANIF